MTLEPAPPSPRARWYHSVWFVLVMLFFVLGPFGLPLLWKSPRFPVWAKWLLTLLSLAFVVWITVKVFDIVHATMAQYQQLSF